VTKYEVLGTLTALTAATLLAAGCGGSTGSDITTSSPAGASASTDAPQMSDQQAPPDRLVIDATIKGGQVTPTDAQLQAKVSETIVVRVNSDTTDQLLVHSNPAHTFTVEAKPAQTFQFSITAPGKVDIQLHQLNKTIATVTVQ
jgi:sporulation-control protein spo0M